MTKKKKQQRQKAKKLLLEAVGQYVYRMYGRPFKRIPAMPHD